MVNRWSKLVASSCVSGSQIRNTHWNSRMRDVTPSPKKDKLALQDPVYFDRQRWLEDFPAPTQIILQFEPTLDGHSSCRVLFCECSVKVTTLKRVQHCINGIWSIGAWKLARKWVRTLPRVFPTSVRHTAPPLPFSPIRCCQNVTLGDCPTSALLILDSAPAAINHSSECCTSHP